MAAITVYIDDSAEERRRRRRRLIEIVILLALIPAAAKMLEAENPPIVRTRVRTVTKTVYRDKIVHDSGASQDIPLPPRVAVEPSLLHFAHCDVGSGTPAQLVKIRNAGGHSLDVALRSTSKDFVITDSCGGGPPCAAAVVFTPSTEGPRNGQLLISGNGMTETVQLSGIATARRIGGGPSDPQPQQHPQPSTISVSLSGSQCPDILQPVIEPAAVHFTGSGRRTITIWNPHPCPLRVTEIELVNADDPKRPAHGYRLEEGYAACKTLLAPQQRCAFDVVTSGIFYTLHARVNVRSVPAPTP
jgi:hypothetical protein